MKTKVLVVLVLSGILFLSACQATVPAPGTTMTSTLQPTKEITVTSTPSIPTTATITPTPTITRTPKPTKIVFYKSPTWDLGEKSTATPLGFQTLTPSPYPTFIVENAVTATLAQAAVCPVEDTSLVINPHLYVKQGSYSNFITDDSLAEMLSMGASFSQIKDLYDNAGLSDEITIKDMTNDNVDDLIYFNGNRLLIVSCEAEKYKSILYEGGLLLNIDFLDDMNLNGIPDLVFSYDPQANGVRIFHIYEWNGQTMEQMENVYHMEFVDSEQFYYREWSRLLSAVFFNPAFSPGPDPEMLGNAKIEVRDLDHNGTKEILVKDSAFRNYFSYWYEEPLRELVLILEWNGEKYLFSNITFSAPEFRFQAVQDADRYFLFRQYDEALAMYDEVVNSTTLKPWSDEYAEYLNDVFYSEDPDSIAIPVITLDEYQQLSAYARYRIMMIQLAQGKQSEAFSSYQLLDQIYTEDNSGYAYADIGRRYWHAVEEGQDLVEACQVVTEYMQANPDLLHALGGSLHGEQSHYYGYDDICPLDETDVALLGGK